jgi:AraC-like DNA-binding protein
MELLRQHRLEVFHAELLDPSQVHVSVAVLLRRCQLANSAATRHAFEARYGQSPAVLRKRSVHKPMGSKGRWGWPLGLIGAKAGSL